MNVSGRPRSVHRWFEAQAARTPRSLAVADGTRRLTYEELDARAGRLAHTLRGAGVRPEAAVGLCCERSVDMVVGLLAVLKAGGAYVPLDPADPDARVRLVIADACISVLLTERALAERFRDAGVSCIVLDAASQPTSEDLRRAPLVDPPEVLEPHAMHVLYTSGSTGRPKGVVTSHAAVLNRLLWGQESFPFRAGDVACARTALGFVDSVAEIFAPLVAGQPLLVVDQATQRDLPRLVEVLAVARVTRLTVVPSMLSTVLAIHPDLGARLPDLRTCFTSGEPIAPTLVRAFQRAMPRCSLVNLYGSTEVAGDATFFDLSGMTAACEQAPIGKPIRGVRAFVLDGALREVAPGETGEICIAGACVASRYLGQPELTAERFVRHALAGGDVLYRTGDLGRRLPSGDLECLGRADRQVKIRGMRVELEEVEQAFARVPGVMRAAVVAPSSARGFRSMVAFYVGPGGDEPLDTAVVRADVARQLPGFMVPSRFIRVERLPLRPSGKVDRALLAALAASPSGSDSFPRVPLEDADERRVAEVWEDVLEREVLGRDESFYDLGGDSLSAARIVVQLEDAFGVRLSLDALFAHPTVAALTAALRALPAQTTAKSTAFKRLGGVEPAGPIPLSYFQLPFWFFSALTGGVPVVSEVFALSGWPSLDVERLQHAYGATAAAFEALWMSFSRLTPMQRAVPRRSLRFTVCDARSASGADAEALLLQEVLAHSSEPFALARPPLIHTRLVRLPNGDDRLLVVIPHVVADMTSMSLFGRALERAYDAEGAPELAASAEPEGITTRLVDVVAWERALPPEALDADVRYWSSVSNGPAWNSLPARFFRAKLTGRKVRALSSRELTSTLENRLSAYAREHRMTVPMALIGAIHASVLAASGQSSATLLVMQDRRRHEETRALFANFTSMMKLHVETAPGDDLHAVVERVAAQLRASYAHGDHQVRKPTLFSDFWTASPRAARRLVERASAVLNLCWPTARLPADILAEYVFALVPWPRATLQAKLRALARPRRSSSSEAARDVLIAVNVLPEVLRPAQARPAPDLRPPQEHRLSVRPRREFAMLVRAEDLIVGTDLLLDTTLQIHVTRTAEQRLAINLYGGAMDQAALDMLNDLVVSRLERLGSASSSELERGAP